MKGKLSCLLSIIAILMGGCCFFHIRAYFKEMNNGYAIIAADRVVDAHISKLEKDSPISDHVIPPSVFECGWNKDFIIAKIHPSIEGEYFEYNNNFTNWYILEVESGEVHGPLSEDEFNSLRTELNVPAKIKFKKVK